MLVLAHRGANREAPENTVAAMARAVELGADGVELDVHRTTDGQLVVRHDAATPSGVLCDLTRAEVAAALPDVPTLGDVLDVCRGILVNVEVKNLPGDPDWDPAEGAADLLVGLLGTRAGLDDVLVSSFHLPTVDRVRATAPELATALLSFGFDPLEALVTAVDHGHAALHPDVWTLAEPGEVVRRAHDAGLRVNVWTVNEPDVPDLALDVLER